MSHTHKQGVGLSRNLHSRLSYSTIATNILSVAILVMVDWESWNSQNCSLCLATRQMYLAQDPLKC